MNTKEILKKTIEFVKTELDGEGSGHDWFHAYRVWKNALLIAETEDADLFVIQLAALLHDIDDWKFHPKHDDLAGPNRATKWLKSLNVNSEIINHVADIIQNLSFKGEGSENKIRSIEGKIVQDADRLDALGAVGKRRTEFHGGGQGDRLGACSP